MSVEESLLHGELHAWNFFSVDQTVDSTIINATITCANIAVWGVTG
jgi:hypothetical protein